MAFAKRKTIYPVPMRLWDTPVPIPNTMVKPRTADGTTLATAWESRWPPNKKKECTLKTAYREKEKRIDIREIENIKTRHPR